MALKRRTWKAPAGYHTSVKPELIRAIHTTKESPESIKKPRSWQTHYETAAGVFSSS
jgi:hypothetical protein